MYGKAFSTLVSFTFKGIIQLTIDKNMFKRAQVFNALIRVSTYQTMKVTRHSSTAFLVAQPVHEAILLHDTPYLAEIASVFTNVKPMLDFIYSSYGSSYNLQYQAPKFEFELISRTFIAFEMLEKRPKECYICFDELFSPRQQLKHTRFKLLVMEKDEHEYDSEDAELMKEGGSTSVHVFHECFLGMDSTQIENPQLSKENFVYEMVSTKMEAMYQQVVKSRDTSLLEDPPNNLLCASAEFLCSSWQLQGYFQELSGLIQKNGKGFKFVSKSREAVHMDQQLWLVIWSSPFVERNKIKTGVVL